MRKFYLLLVAMMVITAASAQEYSWPWKWQGGTIVTETPKRADNQENVLGLRKEKLPVVRIGFVGLGMRGPDAVKRYTYIDGVEIKALCDYEPERAEKCQKILKESGFPPADLYSGEEGYKKLCERDDIDVVYIATDWRHHYLVAKYALEHGKNVASEVPSAMTLTECWDLVNLSEKNRLHCMILENCCYDFFEMTTLNMAQHGVFGEVVKAEGAYIHTLDQFWDAYWKPNGKGDIGWRLRWNKNFRGDVYATHGLGPVAQVMNIHRGDRMKTLVAMDTKSVVGKELVEKATGEKCEEFQNGDNTTTLIRTENGKVIEIQHNVMDPQPYNRRYQIVGSRGMANKYPIEGYALSKQQLEKSGVTPVSEKISAHSFLPEADRKALEEKYIHPITKKYEEKARMVGGHGGMDFIMDSRLVYCLQNGLPLDTDVYDLAEWCSMAELGYISMSNNSAPVACPDFTRGYWDKVSGYHHAYASPEDEAIAEKKAKEFTEKMKAGAAKKWQALEKKAKK